MDKLLNVLGLKSLDDIKSILPTNIFDKIDDQLIIDLAKEYHLKMNLDNLTSERKMEIVNRIFQLFYGRIIDSIKEIDGLYVTGFKLEYMPI